MPSRAQLAERIRDGLLLAASRTYAEQYVEPFIREKYKLLAPTSGDHDAVSRSGTRYEIKASKVLRSTGNRKPTRRDGLKSRSLVERILFEHENHEIGRVVPFSEHLTSDYLANIQNVKRSHFDYLLYVLLFKDCVKVFKAKTSVIKTGSFPSWSDKHGRYDKVGMSGQFPITKTNIQWHLENHLIGTMSYEEITEIYESLSEPK
jgi:hypothetical protein